VSKEHDALLVSGVDIGRNALWNYVSLMVWLRWLRRLRIACNTLPIVLASFGSWRILTDNTSGNIPFVAAAFAFAGGLLPLIYLASGVDENIGLVARLAGRYRRLEAQIRDFVIRFHDFDNPTAQRRYEDLLDDYLELKGEAHTVPRWAFSRAERLIEKREYIAVSVEDTVRQSLPSLSAQNQLDR
jgi:hypothetical protein